MRVSVIICTRNRSDSMGETLKALARLEYPDFEVLVADSSDGAEKEKTEKWAREHKVKYVSEPRRGLSIARNTGCSLATGEIIAFTDDDCLPEKDWLTRTVQNFSDPAVWACSGRVVQHIRDDASDLFEEVAGQDLGPERRTFSKQDTRIGPGFLLANVLKVFAKHMKSRAPVPFGVGHGSSMTFRKEIFGKIGGFDVALGSGAPLQGCDDIEMFYRILKSGHLVVYEPTAVVRHRHRLTVDEVYRTRHMYSFGGAAFMKLYGKDPLMFFLFHGRLLQLTIKSAQYKLLRNAKLAKSFSSDLRGFLAGWTAYRQFAKARRSPS